MRRPTFAHAFALTMCATLIAGCSPVRDDEIASLADHVPPETAMMAIRREETADAHRLWHPRMMWRPLAQISPNLIDAVIVSEDAAFFTHDGIDVGELRESLKKDLKEKRFARGGSTITQQLAKNLYLTPSKVPWRKVQEYFIARQLEGALSKDRILELYLNLIEWGDGIFGAEAASRAYFHVGASELTPAEAARLASIIPNPRKFSAHSTSRHFASTVERCLVRMSERADLRRRFPREPLPDEARVPFGPQLPDSPLALPDTSHAHAPTK